MTYKKCLKCNKSNNINSMRYSFILKRYICFSCDNNNIKKENNRIKLQNYTYKENNEIVQQFTLDNELEIYLTFNLKTKKFKELDIEITQCDNTFCKTLDKEVFLELINFLKENLGELMK